MVEVKLYLEGNLHSQMIFLKNKKIKITGIHRIEAIKKIENSKKLEMKKYYNKREVNN